jgi:L-ribulose-5-phosphate 4-epimerase
MLDDLKRLVCEANRLIESAGLAQLTWGNVSGMDRATGSVVIKPSGVAYDALEPSHMVVVRLDDGSVVDGSLRPSSDTPAHLELYRAFPGIGGICHTHSPHATMFAQAGRELPCFGTTHADHFFGTVPLCRALDAAEVAVDYERNTGRAIVAHFRDRGIDPVEMPGVLQAGHAPFTWGRTPIESVQNSIALEACARIAIGTLLLNPDAAPLATHILEKHHRRKHGPDAYYGQARAPGTRGGGGSTAAR